MVEEAVIIEKVFDAVELEGFNFEFEFGLGFGLELGRRSGLLRLFFLLLDRLFLLLLDDLLGLFLLLLDDLFFLLLDRFLGLFFFLGYWKRFLDLFDKSSLDEGGVRGTISSLIRETISFLTLSE